MIENKSIKNFLFMLSGIVLLFCASLPNLADAVLATLRYALSFLGFGWVAALLNLSKIVLVLGAVGLATVGVVFSIIDAQAQKRQPNWIVVGCVGGSSFFALIGAFVPVLFWIGFLSIPALVVAMIMAYKDVLGEWKNPVSKVATFMMIGILVAFWNRCFNVYMGISSIHILASLCSIAAFVYLCVWQSKFFEAIGKPVGPLFMIGCILYAVADFFNMIPVLGIVGMLLAIGAWVPLLIAHIKMLNCQGLCGLGRKGALVVLIAHCVAVLSFLPVINLASVAGLGFGWWLIVAQLEKKA